MSRPVTEGPCCGLVENDTIHDKARSDGVLRHSYRAGAWTCPLCKRNKFARAFEPHKCIGGFRKNFRARTAKGSEPPDWVWAASKAIENADFEGETGADDYARLIHAAYLASFGPEWARDVAAERNRIEAMEDALEAVSDPVGYCDRTGQDPYEENWIRKKLSAALSPHPEKQLSDMERGRVDPAAKFTGERA